MAIAGVNSNYVPNYPQSKSVGGEHKQTSRTTEEYTNYLQDKFDYMNKSTSMEGIPTTVTVSPAFLEKCANDPEKAKFLEENLKAIPDCVKSFKNYLSAMPGGLVATYAEYQFDDEGNITILSGCTNDPDGKIQRENTERKVKEGKEKAEKAKEKREKKLAEQEKAEEKRAEEKAHKEEFAITMTGSSVKEIAAKLGSVAIDSTWDGSAGFFDMRA